MADKPFGWRPFTEEHRQNLRELKLTEEQIADLEKDNTYKPIPDAVSALHLSVAMLHAVGRRFGPDVKVIKYRAELALAKRVDPNVPEFFERDCYDLGNAFDACLVEAGISRPVVDARGKPATLPPRRKLGETDPRPKLRGRGTPNTLRHTIITEMHARGVPEAQIEAAAGHIGEGTNKRNYRHLRPDYLAELIEAVEDYWSEMKRYTAVHLRS